MVAEGVETSDQLTFLQSIGCATGQGYLFMPAVTSDQAEELLERDLSDQVDTRPGPRPAELRPSLTTSATQPVSSDAAT